MDVYKLVLRAALSPEDCRVTNVTLGILLVCFCCFNVSVHDPGNYGTVSHANALDKVAEMIIESQICGHLSKIHLGRAFKERIILKLLKIIEKMFWLI